MIIKLFGRVVSELMDFGVYGFSRSILAGCDRSFGSLGRQGFIGLYGV